MAVAQATGATARSGTGGPLRAAHDWLRGSQPGLVGLALLIGAGAGLGAVVFRYLILWFTELFTGRADYSDAGRVASPHFPGLGVFFLLLAPVIGGLLYGPLVNRFAREARGHGVPEVMFAVARNRGRIPARVAVVKSLASALCIGSGGSVGREGPIVQIGSALGSSIGQWLRVPDHRLRLMVACGAAGGISATFNAPIAGVFFGLELILRSFSAEAFGVVVLSSVTAAAVGRAVLGSAPFIVLPGFTMHSPLEYLCYAGLGLLAGLLGWAFARVLYAIEDLCDWAWRGPEWLRPAVGGLLLGGLLLVLPQMYGVGYPVLEKGVTGGYALGFLLVLLVGKMIATSLTIGIGGSGGVFAPSLFVGAMGGTAFGMVMQAAFPALHISPGAYGLVGMAAVFAGASHAPITAVLIVFELTGQYSIILPLMAAVVLATGMSHLVSRETIYTLKLLRRGVDLNADHDAAARPDVLHTLTVGQAMRPLPAPLAASAGHAEIVERLAAARYGALPVLDDEGYRGAVTATALNGTDDGDRTAVELARDLPPLRADRTLDDALDALREHEGTGLPVVAADGGEPIGWLDHRDVLAAYGAARPEPAPA
ncbi:chloride channel protein [Pseudonocardia acidicola]|uniref:CBS domain-containing protein n=1 Tax=Pseudonocardia acidicola TaxID=2724939 RepID=A0ABX1SMN0_9PSEU|nr:chloride channel protein [Pseudonocardia acidicola]NMI01794.1 CBS domain-containing protein [Pseudonocardia acidicola]